MKKYRWMIAFMIILAMSLPLCACGSNQYRAGWIETSDSSGVQARFDRFDGKEEARSFNLGVGDQLVIEIQTRLESGTLDVQILDPQGDLMAASSFDCSGNDEIIFSAAQKGWHQLQILGDDASGEFEVLWESN